MDPIEGSSMMSGKKSRHFAVAEPILVVLTLLVGLHLLSGGNANAQQGPFPENRVRLMQRWTESSTLDQQRVALLEMARAFNELPIEEAKNTGPSSHFFLLYPGGQSHEWYNPALDTQEQRASIKYLLEQMHHLYDAYDFLLGEEFGAALAELETWQAEYDRTDRLGEYLNGDGLVDIGGSHFFYQLYDPPPGFERDFDSLTKDLRPDWDSGRNTWRKSSVNYNKAWWDGTYVDESLDTWYTSDLSSSKVVLENVQGDVREHWGKAPPPAYRGPDVRGAVYEYRQDAWRFAQFNLPALKAEAYAGLRDFSRAEEEYWKLLGGIQGDPCSQTLPSSSTVSATGFAKDFKEGLGVVGSSGLALQPEERTFVAIRRGLNFIAWGDRLFKQAHSAFSPGDKQRLLSDARQKYEAALCLFPKTQVGQEIDKRIGTLSSFEKATIQKLGTDQVYVPSPVYLQQPLQVAFRQVSFRPSWAGPQPSAAAAQITQIQNMTRLEAAQSSASSLMADAIASGRVVLPGTSSQVPPKTQTPGPQGGGSYSGPRVSSTEGLQLNVDLPGNDYKGFDLDEKNPQLCRQACLADPVCQAFTYGKPEDPGAQAKCYLKDAVPSARRDACCISGFKGRQSAPPGGGSYSGPRERTGQVPPKTQTPGPQGGGSYSGPGERSSEAPAAQQPAPGPPGGGSYSGPRERAASANLEFGVNMYGSDYDEPRLEKAEPELCRNKCLQDPRCKAFSYVKPGVRGEQAKCYLKDAVPERERNSCCVSGEKRFLPVVGESQPGQPLRDGVRRGRDKVVHTQLARGTVDSTSRRSKPVAARFRQRLRQLLSFITIADASRFSPLSGSSPRFAGLGTEPGVVSSVNRFLSAQDETSVQWKAIKATTGRDLVKQVIPLITAEYPFENPLITETVAHAKMQLFKIAKGVNYLGYFDGYVPDQRYSFLFGMASQYADMTSQVEARHIQFKTAAEQSGYQTRQLDQNAQLSVVEEQIAERRGQIAEDRVKQAELKIKQIDNKIKGLQSPWGTVFKSVVAIAGIVGSAFTGGASALATVGAMASFTAGQVGSMAATASDIKSLQYQKRVVALDKAMAEREGVIADLQGMIAKSRGVFMQENLRYLDSLEFNEVLYYNLATTLNRVKRSYLDAGIRMGYLGERALAFESGDPDLQFIQFDYERSDLKGLLAGDLLKQDLMMMEADRALRVKQRSHVKHVISLRQHYPLEFSELIETGRMDFETRLYEFDKAYPGTYQRRLRRVEVAIHGLVGPEGFKGSLTNFGTFLVRDLEGSRAANRLIPSDQEFQTAYSKLNQTSLSAVRVGGVVAFQLPPAKLVLSRYDLRRDSIVFPAEPELRETFEGFGAGGLWSLALPKNLNDADYRTIADVQLILYFDANYDPEVERKIGGYYDRTSGQWVDGLVAKYERELSRGERLDQLAAFSLRQHFPDEFFSFSGGTVSFELLDGDFPLYMSDKRVKQVIVRAVDRYGRGVAGVGMRADKLTNPDKSLSLPLRTRPDGYTLDLAGQASLMLPKPQRVPVVGGWRIGLDDPAQVSKVHDLMVFFQYEYEEKKPVG